MDKEGLLYREFSIRCTRGQLIRLSDWLNDNLDFGGGEDFDKLADKPRAQVAEDMPQTRGEDRDVCTTDRAPLVKWLELMADLIPQLPNGSSLPMQNNARRMRLLAQKLRRSLQKGGKGTEAPV